MIDLDRCSRARSPEGREFRHGRRRRAHTAHRNEDQQLDRGGRKRPVGAFAVAVCDQNPIYRDPRASEAAGFDAIPAPPTFPFVMETWGRFAELQPEDSSCPAGAWRRCSDLSWPKAGSSFTESSRSTITGPVVVGDVLDGEVHGGRRVHEGFEGPNDDVRRHRDGLAGSHDRRAGRHLAIQRHPPRLTSDSTLSNSAGRVAA